MNHPSKRVLIISTAFQQAFCTPLSNITKILFSINPENSLLFFHTPDIVKDKNLLGNNIFSHEIKKPRTICQSIFNNLTLEVRIAFFILKYRSQYDHLFFFTAKGHLIPMIVGLFVGKKNHWMLPASINKMMQFQNYPLSSVLVVNQLLCLAIVNNVILYSKNLIGEWDLARYTNKILIAGEHYINIDKFNIITPFTERETAIGFVGRFYREKGILNFINSLEEIKQQLPHCRIYIIGDGDLRQDILEIIKNRKISHITIIPWVEHDRLPYCLNKLRLLIIPSYTEGLPNIMLESMACGTPVLATPVGAIPDVIRDGDTGFIMENNSPECIVENVIRVLKSPYLERIAKNGEKKVSDNFSLNKTLDRWRSIFDAV